MNRLDHAIEIGDTAQEDLLWDEQAEWLMVESDKGDAMKTDKPSHGSGKTQFNRGKRKGESWVLRRKRDYARDVLHGLSVLFAGWMEDGDQLSRPEVTQELAALIANVARSAEREAEADVRRLERCPK